MMRNNKGEIQTIYLQSENAPLSMKDLFLNSIYKTVNSPHNLNWRFAFLTPEIHKHPFWQIHIHSYSTQSFSLTYLILYSTSPLSFSQKSIGFS